MALANQLPVGPMRKVTVGIFVTELFGTEFVPTVVRTTTNEWVLVGNGMLVVDEDNVVVAFSSWDQGGAALIGTGQGNFAVQHNPRLTIV